MAQLRVPLELTVTFAALLPDVDVALRHRIPTGPAFHVPETEPPLEAQLTVTEATVPGAAPMPPEAANVAHSLARPMISPTLDPAKAELRAWRYWGKATAERMPMTATTIISSTKVKPLAMPLRCLLSVRRRVSLVLAFMAFA